MMRVHRGRSIALLSVLFTVACSIDFDRHLAVDAGATPVDGGTTDAGVDAGEVDAGPEPCDCPCDDVCDTGPCMPRVRVTAIEAGGAHTCALDAEGRMWCWGDNGSGQLGRGTTEPSFVPIPVRLSNVTAIGAGDMHTCGVVDGQDLHCWGEDTRAQVGNGPVPNEDVLDPVHVMPGTGFTAVGLGGSSCAISTVGGLWCWGPNDHGQNGQGDVSAWRGNPADVALDNWRRISVGAEHVCAIRAGGELRCWGQGSSGRLGHSATGSASSPIVPTGDFDYQEVSAGDRHTCGVFVSGELFCWGSRAEGRTGMGSDSGATILPQLVDMQTDWTNVSAGLNHTCALRAGELHCFGANDQSQLGLPGATPRLLPERVEGDGWELVSAGSGFTCGVRDGALYCWGANAAGQLGLGDVAERDVPTRVCLGP